MRQVCKFSTRPATINNGGYKRGHWIVWVNLQVSEIAQPDSNLNECFHSVTERLVLADCSLSAFLDVVEPAYIAEATTDELDAILHFFQSENDVESWRLIRKVQIQGYDRSGHINGFYLDDSAVWLDKATRVGLVNSITIEKNTERCTTCLWLGGHKINMSVDVALGVLYQVELYALNCYNVTAQHLIQVDRCGSVDELRAFDIHSDYPEMLHFKTKE